MTEEDQGRDGIDGDDPMQEVGPEGCEASPNDIDIEPGERSGEVQESEWDTAAEIDEAFPVEELATALAEDGLPDHSADPVGGASEAHPFTIDTVCCLEDDRQYVELFDDELQARGWESLSGSSWRAPDMSLLDEPLPLRVRSRYHSQDGVERSPFTFEPQRVEHRWGTLLVRVESSLGLADNNGKAAAPIGSSGGPPAYVAVRPLRERCIYYKRQHFANDDAPDPMEPGHNIVFRNCTHPARRSIGGASMSVRDQAVYGCDYRDPFDAKSVEWMDKLDRNKIKTRPDLIRLPLFGLAGDEVHIPEEGKAQP